MTGNSASSDNSIFIETERLILRPLRLEDVDDLLEYQSHPDIVRYIPWPERTREQVIEALEKTLNIGKSELKDEGDFIVLAWELKDLTGNPKYAKTVATPGYRPGKVIGQSNSGLKSTNDQCADIGWVTHQNFQRQGLAFEATHALMKFLFDSFNLHRLVADIDARNPESAAMAEKLGMRREAEFKSSEFFKGDWCSMWLYAILKEEFEA
jgi:RimJ/RimL family protein N-acetyltransferase